MNGRRYDFGFVPDSYIKHIVSSKSPIGTVSSLTNSQSRKSWLYLQAPVE